MCVVSSIAENKYRKKQNIKKNFLWYILNLTELVANFQNGNIKTNFRYSQKLVSMKCLVSYLKYIQFKFMAKSF